MNPLLIVVPVVIGAARWLKNDAHRRDHDPQSQERSDYLEYKQNEDRIDAQIKRAKRGKP